MDVPIELGAGAGAGLLAQAPRPRAAIARAATAAIVAIFMVIVSPPFLAVAGANVSELLRLTIQIPSSTRGYSPPSTINQNSRLFRK